MPVPIVPLINIAGGLLGGLFGGGQKKEGEKILKNLNYPVESLPQEYQENKNLAQTMASTGMPSEQYNLAMKNIQRQQLMALRGARDRRGGLNVLPQILQGTNDATLQLDAANAAQKSANQRTLLGINSQIGGINRDLFDKNERQRYERDYGYGMSLKGIGNQNLFGGLERGLSGLIGLFGNNKKNNADYYGQDGTGGG